MGNKKKFKKMACIETSLHNAMSYRRLCAAFREEDGEEFTCQPCGHGETNSKSSSIPVKPALQEAPCMAGARDGRVDDAPSRVKKSRRRSRPTPSSPTSTASSSRGSSSTCSSLTHCGTSSTSSWLKQRVARSGNNSDIVRNVPTATWARELWGHFGVGLDAFDLVAIIVHQLFIDF